MPGTHSCKLMKIPLEGQMRSCGISKKYTYMKKTGKILSRSAPVLHYKIPAHFRHLWSNPAKSSQNEKNISKMKKSASPIFLFLLESPEHFPEIPGFSHGIYCLDNPFGPGSFRFGAAYPAPEVILMGFG